MDFVDLVVIGCCKADERLCKAPKCSGLKLGDTVQVKGSKMLRTVRDSITVCTDHASLQFILRQFGADSLDDVIDVVGVMNYFSE